MTGPLQDKAYEADCAGQFAEAGCLYWRAFEVGEPFDLATTLRALFIFFDSTDGGVASGLGLTNDDMEVARQRFHRILEHLRSLGHGDDADVWRDRIGRFGGDFPNDLPPGSLEIFAERGSQEAAWLLATNGDRSAEVVALASSLKVELSRETSFRSAYILHMLKDFLAH